MENQWYNKHRNNYIYSLPQSYKKSKYNKNKKEIVLMISIYAIRNTHNNILKHFLCQLNTT